MKLNEKTAAPREAFVFEQGYDIATTLPAPIPLSGALSANFDLFVCALGFEERCVAIPQAMSNNISQLKFGPKFKIGLVGRYRTNAADNLANEPLLSHELNKLCAATQFVDADEPELVRTHLASLVKKLMDSCSPCVRVCFDISACSGTFILTVVGALLELKIPTDLTVLYCQAEQYFPTNEQFTDHRKETVQSGSELGEVNSCYSEQGVQEPTVHPQYPGFPHEGRPDYIIAIPSFRMNRMVRCINVISEQAIAAPESSVYWIFGSPSLSQESWRNALQREIVMAALRQIGSGDTATGETWLNRDNSTDCCVFDYRKILTLILQITDQNLGKNITCIPMGSKMQSIGVALGLAVRDEISVTYARPATFSPQTYSGGVGQMWELSLGRLSEMLQLLFHIGKLEATTPQGKIKTLSSI